MIRFAEILTESRPTPFWTMLRQMDVSEVVGVLPRGFMDWRQASIDRPWDYAPLAVYKHMIEDEGLTLSCIEDNPPMDRLRHGAPGAEEELEQVLAFVETLGKLKIPLWCYNWAASLGWQRTTSRLRGRGGAIVSGYHHALLRDAPPPALGPIAAEKLWDTLQQFLEKVIPVAEKAQVKLAMHPDDPPMLSEIRGVARIMNSVDAYRRLLSLNPSAANGATLCQGNFTLMTDDLPGVIRELGASGRVYFVHFRDVRGTPERFAETFIDEGQTDMAACMRAYRDIGFDGIMRSDHTPTMAGDEALVPGYSDLGRLHAIGYMTGLRDAVWSE